MTVRLDIPLWIAAGVLAAVMVAAGTMKLLTSKQALEVRPGMGFVADFSATQIKLIAAAEILGAIGLIVPRLIGVLPVLTPIAAALLAVLMLGAVATHLRRKEPVGTTLVLAALALFVAIGRSGLLS